MDQKEFGIIKKGNPARIERADRKNSTKSTTERKVNRFIGAMLLIVLAFISGVIAARVWDGVGAFRGVEKSVVNFIGDVRGSDQDVEIEDLNFDLFWDVWNDTVRGYVDTDKVDEKKMFYGSIKGAVSSLGDPATVFLTPEETKTFEEGSAGNFFSGIGAELGYKNGSIVIISPLDGSPAAKAGLRPGDVIQGVDGEDLAADANIFDVVAKIRGEAGTDVKLKIGRSGESDLLEVSITRGDINVPSMEFELVEGENRIALFDISRFTDSSLNDWQSNWDKLVSQFENSGADAIIIDLRGNPGGFFNAAVYAASDFLPKGSIVVQQEDRNGKVNEFDVSREGRLLDVPLVVLVNEGSASASEILAGALKLNDRATVIGENTYGKGTAQDVVRFKDGSSLHLTILKWLLPDGSWINPDNPVVPDTTVELNDEHFKAGEDPQLDAAIQFLKSEI